MNKQYEVCSKLFVGVSRQDTSSWSLCFYFYLVGSTIEPGSVVIENKGNQDLGCPYTSRGREVSVGDPNIPLFPSSKHN